MRTIVVSFIPSGKTPSWKKFLPCRNDIILYRTPMLLEKPQGETDRSRQLQWPHLKYSV
jgi:hypothetical protein